MSRIALVAAGVIVLAGWPAAAQQVAVSTLAEPDAFSLPGRETDLPPTLWRGTSLDVVKRVLPTLGTKPLTPAGQHLARRLAATGAHGPDGAGPDPTLVGARATALIALGDPAAASRILDRAPGVDRSAELSRGAAELALLAADDARACSISDTLGVGRHETYWLRLRAYCQALAGQTAQAQLTLDLAQTQARDAIYGRLMTAKLGAGAPGAASLRNGLDYALSRSLNLDLKTAKPEAGVAAAIAGGDPIAPAWDLSALDATYGGVPGVITSGGQPPAAAVSALISAAAEADAKTRAKLQGAALLVAALAPELSGDDRAKLAAFTVADGKAPLARDLALDYAAERKLAGETALVALWIAADGGTALPLGDRIRIVRALAQVGLDADARAFAAEGLAALK